MDLFEALMLICFGIGWPISIAKSLRTKKVIGKSLLFMTIVCIGYISGIVYKITHGLDWVIFLYGLNMIMICLDIYLYLKYLPKSPVPYINVG